jgi:hypothetical protein
MIVREAIQSFEALLARMCRVLNGTMAHDGLTAGQASNDNTLVSAAPTSAEPSNMGNGTSGFAITDSENQDTGAKQ